MTGNPHLQAHLQFTQANARPKIAKELISFLPVKNYFLKLPSLLKILKPTTHSRQKSNSTTTAKTHTDRGLTKTVDRRSAYVKSIFSDPFLRQEPKSKE